ncbi:hypothetical protein ACIA5G_20845 [Amycolatopsis sp. NPDC051758]|uniref:hypothetical protein n=1 Tax=Amycolatopsis sp. NPDC051758 TaxID=3363935 RepID=UPI003790A626
MRRSGLQLQRCQKEVVERGPETFKSTERVVLTSEELALATIPEFLVMLRLVLEKSGLTAGQVAAKTSIARSSAYNLVAVTRTGLPIDPGQVRLFLSGCGLRIEQVDEVMHAWKRLGFDRRRRRSGRAAKPESAPRRRAPGADTCLEHIQRSRASGDLAGAAAWARRLAEALLAECAQPGV